MINRLLFAFALLLSMMATSNAFTSSRRVLKGAASSVQKSTVKLAAAKKAATKKDEEEVVNFKKAEFVAAVADKTGMTKGDSEKALSAVLNVIATVSRKLLV
jgi:hypothetical protein